MIAGITGHQDLGNPDALEWVRASLDALVVVERVHSGLTSLAEGADQVFADILRARGVPFVAVVPSKSYESAFHSTTGRAKYLELLSLAKSTVELPFTLPSEQAFLAGGQYVALHCDVLYAVWDGLPAKGLGGTADVVQFAVAHHRKTVHLNPVARTIVHL